MIVDLNSNRRARVLRVRTLRPDAEDGCARDNAQIYFCLDDGYCSASRYHYYDENTSIPNTEDEYLRNIHSIPTASKDDDDGMEKTHYYCQFKYGARSCWLPFATRAARPCRATVKFWLVFMARTHAHYFIIAHEAFQRMITFQL